LNNSVLSNVLTLLSNPLGPNGTI